MHAKNVQGVIDINKYFVFLSLNVLKILIKKTSIFEKFWLPLFGARQIKTLKYSEILKEAQKIMVDSIIDVQGSEIIQCFATIKLDSEIVLKTEALGVTISGYSSFDLFEGWSRFRIKVC